MDETIGMTRREIERELAWILRSPPGDPGALVTLLSEAIATIVDKNNRALARALAERDPDGEP